MFTQRNLLNAIALNLSASGYKSIQEASEKDQAEAIGKLILGNEARWEIDFDHDELMKAVGLCLEKNFDFVSQQNLKVILKKLFVKESPYIEEIDEKLSENLTENDSIFPENKFYSWEDRMEFETGARR